jgi:2-oxoglutarate ferredoxin oxidoreductase subunit delta
VKPKIYIDKERCKGCGYCVEFCPKKLLSMSSELGHKGYKMAQVYGESECLGCGLCEAICPDFAIKSIPSDDNTTTNKNNIETSTTK